MRLRHHPFVAHLGDPLDRRVPVVVDVVVVEDHRGGHGREQPADHRLAPRSDVELHVVVVADDLLALDLPLDGRVDLVGVDLVAEQQQRVRPLLGRGVAHPQRQPAQRVDLAAFGVLVLAQGVRRLVRGGDAAGAEDDPRPRVLGVRAQDARREAAVRLRPDDLAVQRHLVRRRRVGRQPVDVDERVVVALDAEGPLARGGATAGADLDLTRPVGLDPDRRLFGARMPQHAGRARASRRGSEVVVPADAVQGRALGRGAAGAVGGGDEIVRVELDAVIGARHPADRLLHQGPSEVVDAPAQRLGGGVDAHLHPARLQAAGSSCPARAGRPPCA